MREAEREDVLGELVREVAVRQADAPRAEVDLVDAHGRGVRVAGGAPGDPLLVAPDEALLDDDRRGGGRDLGAARQRVGLLPPRAVLAEDLELVAGTRADARGEDLPDAAVAERAHGVRGALPVVEVADHAHGAGVGGPDGERGAADLAELARVGVHVGAEDGPERLVAALAHQMAVELLHGGQEAVGVVGDRGQRVVRDLEAVVGHVGDGEDGDPDAVLLVPRRDPAGRR